MNERDFNAINYSNYMFQRRMSDLTGNLGYVPKKCWTYIEKEMEGMTPYQIIDFLVPRIALIGDPDRLLTSTDWNNWDSKVEHWEKNQRYVCLMGSKKVYEQLDALIDAVVEAEDPEDDLWSAGLTPYGVVYALSQYSDVTFPSLPKYDAIKGDIQKQKQPRRREVVSCMSNYSTPALTQLVYVLTEIDQFPY